MLNQGLRQGEKDINCLSCPRRAGEKCSIEEGSPIRKCVIAINEKLAEELAVSGQKMKVLEIGCGNWSRFRDVLPPKVEWEGVDPKPVGKNKTRTIATVIGSVESMPFFDETFDLVLSNQSIEHWYEYGVSFRSALAEISRVLKSGGILAINVGIFVHGHRLFLKGNEQAISHLFPEEFWEVVSWERWRRDPAPLEPYRAWKNSPYSDCLGESYSNESSYILNIHFKKKKLQTVPMPLKVFYALSSAVIRLLPNQVKKLVSYGPVCALRILRNVFAHRLFKR
jgi:SAM-dependent methyltransferase